MSVLLHNISLLGPVQTSVEPVRGMALDRAEFLSGSWLLMEAETIRDFGTGAPDFSSADQIIDARGGAVLPAFVDCHTHLVFADWREEEYVRKLRGESYAAIAAAGGGIINSARKLAACSEDELFERSLKRLHEIMELGTGAIEVKSGYGLTTETELRMLRVARRLGIVTGIPVRTTFLGAHAVPEGWSRSDYVDLVIREMIPAVAAEGLADFIDVFCEAGFFSLEESIRILTAGLASGMVPRVHAHQLARSGGVKAGIEVGARSVDHLEQMEEEDIIALAGSSVYPVLLPGAAFFLGLPWPPARKMQESGLPLVVASDFNPGSSPSGNMMEMWSLACSGMRLSPVAALQAMTMNAACLLGIADTHGSIARGKSASLLLTLPTRSVEWLPYRFGMPAIQKVFINGREFLSSAHS